MDFPINPAAPRIMHIDLNACFAMTEQQANPLLRGRPVAVTNRLTPGAIIIAPSYEAKRFGVRCGTRVDDAKRMAPGLVVLETDPAKYKYVHNVIKAIFADYTPNVTMKSIDEGVLDFSGMDQLRGGRSLEAIGREIKVRVRESLGEWMTVNVGIATNRFLAKLAAGLNKPDGLNVVDASNLELTYAFRELMDLPGINRRFNARLRLAGITTVLEFLAASERKLSKEIFRSINGRHWYLRLRGYEVDDFPTTMRTIGKQFVLRHFTAEPEAVRQVVHEMAIGVARRMRSSGRSARGLAIDCRYAPPRGQELPDDLRRYHAAHLFAVPTTQAEAIFWRAEYLLREAPAGLLLKQIALSSYALGPPDKDQLQLYQTDLDRTSRLDAAVQAVNDRYGELALAPAALLGTPNRVSNKIAFGSTRYFDS